MATPNHTNPPPPGPAGVPSRTHALILGLIQGPTELLPVSSSAHTALIPWLLRWPAARAEPDLRKSLEVALHAGTALALLGDLRGRLGELDPRTRAGAARIALLTLSLAPPALAGWLLERPIERRLGGPGPIAAGLLAGSLAMLAADRSAERSGAARRAEEAGALDGLLLGLAQAAALAPGVSRSGATLAMARARGFARADARELAGATQIPVILAAASLKSRRLLRSGLPAGAGGALAVGLLGAAVSTRAAVAVARRRPGRGSLAPYAAYRGALAAAAYLRLHRTPRGTGGHNEG